MARWRFQFWLSLPYRLCDSCSRYRGVCGNIPSSMPVPFFQCLLLWSTFHIHTKNMDMARERISLILELMAMFLVVPNVWSLHLRSGLSSTVLQAWIPHPILNFQIFKATDGLHFLAVFGDISAGAICALCHQPGLLCTDLHAICHGGLFKVIYQLDQL